MEYVLYQTHVHRSICYLCNLNHSESCSKFGQIFPGSICFNS